MKEAGQFAYTISDKRLATQDAHSLQLTRFGDRYTTKSKETRSWRADQMSDGMLT